VQQIENADKKIPVMNGARLSSNAIAITVDDFMEDMPW
jgi:hypothetical protein